MISNYKRVLPCMLCIIVVVSLSNACIANALSDTDMTSAYFTNTAPSKLQVNVVDARTQKISWKPVQAAEGYYVYCSTKENGEYSCIGTTQGTSMHSMDLKIGTKYYYKVQAYQVINGTYYYSPISETVTKAAGYPKTPSISVQKIKKDGKVVVIVRWSNISDAKYIQLYRKKAGQGYKKILDKKITKSIRNGVTISYVKTTGEMLFKARTYNQANTSRFHSQFSIVRKVKLK